MESTQRDISTPKTINIENANTISELEKLFEKYNRIYLQKTKEMANLKKEAEDILVILELINTKWKKLIKQE